MKILQINKFHNPRRGADKHFLDVVELLGDGGHEVASFCMAQKGDVPSPWETYFLSPVGYTDKFTLWQNIKGVGRMFYSPEAHRNIRKLLDAFAPDVVHIHNIYHQMDPTILFAIKKRNIPIVMTVHDFKLINPNHAMMLAGKPYERCKNGAYYQCLLDRCVKNSHAKSFIAMLEAYWHRMLGTYGMVDVFIAPSVFVKNRLEQWGIPGDKIRVIAHFVPQEGTVLQEKEYTAEDQHPYAFYAGKISQEKGVDMLLRIFSEQSGLKLYLAGEIEEGFVIPKSDQVVYLGIVPPDKVRRYMREARCVISATRLPETFGLIALEAIASGTGFVGFDTGAFSEIITDERYGILVQSEEELRSAVHKIGSRKVFFDRSAIIARSAEFDGKAYLATLEELYAALAAERMKPTKIDKKSKKCYHKRLIKR